MLRAAIVTVTAEASDELSIRVVTKSPCSKVGIRRESLPAPWTGPGGDRRNYFVPVPGCSAPFAPAAYGSSQEPPDSTSTSVLPS